MSDPTSETVTPAPEPGNVTEIPAPDVVNPDPPQSVPSWAQALPETPDAPETPNDAPTLPRALQAILDSNRELQARLEALESRTQDDARALAQMNAAARERVLDEVGLLSEYRPAVPASIDPTTPDGRKALDAWVAARPAMVRAPAAPEVRASDLIPVDAKTSWLGKSPEQLREWIAQGEAYRGRLQ